MAEASSSRVALVTGASSGLGSRFARVLAANGALTRDDNAFVDAFNENTGEIHLQGIDLTARVLLDPGDGLLQTFFETDAGFPVEQGLGLLHQHRQHQRQCQRETEEIINNVARQQRYKKNREQTTEITKMLRETVEITKMLRETYKITQLLRETTEIIRKIFVRQYKLRLQESETAEI